MLDFNSLGLQTVIIPRRSSVIWTEQSSQLVLLEQSDQSESRFYKLYVCSGIPTQERVVTLQIGGEMRLVGVTPDESWIVANDTHQGPHFIHIESSTVIPLDKEGMFEFVGWVPTE